MGNCLKTQLKEVVNNPNLKKMGLLVVPFSTMAYTSGTVDFAYLGNNVSVKCYDNNKQEISIPNLRIPYGTEGTLEFDNKYDITLLNVFSIDGIVQLDDLEYSKITEFKGDGVGNTKCLNNIIWTGDYVSFGNKSIMTGDISYIHLTSSVKYCKLPQTLTGNIDNFAEAIGLLELNCVNNLNLLGNIETLSNLTALNELNLGSCTGLQGSMVTLLNTMATNRTSGTMRVTSSTTITNPSEATGMLYYIDFGSSYPNGWRLRNS